MELKCMAAPIQALEQEHRYLAKVLAVLSRMEKRLAGGEEIRIPDLFEALLFLRFFAEECHQAKEEAWLFPILNRKGGAVGKEMVSVLLEDHQKIRGDLRRLVEISSAYSGGDGAGQELRERLRELLDLYEDHLWKEDQLLLPIARKALSAMDEVALRDGFNAVEAEIGAELHHHFEEFANQVDESVAAGN